MAAKLKETFMYVGLYRSSSLRSNCQRNLNIIVSSTETLIKRIRLFFSSALNLKKLMTASEQIDSSDVRLMSYDSAVDEYWSSWVCGAADAGWMLASFECAHYRAFSDDVERPQLTGRAARHNNPSSRHPRFVAGKQATCDV